MRSLLLLLLLFIVAACSRSGQDDLPRPSALESEVYTALIGQMALGSPEQTNSSAVLTRKTAIKTSHSMPSINSPLPRQVHRDIPTLTEALWTDFTQRNAEQAELRNVFTEQGVTEVVHEDSIDAIFSSPPVGGWHVFHDRYPEAEGIITVSRVGFNADNSQALVFFAFNCGGLCGSGKYAFLRRMDGEWRLIATSIAWEA